MHYLVVILITQNLFNLCSLYPFYLFYLSRAVICRSSGKFFAMLVYAVNYLACFKYAINFCYAGWQQTFPLFQDSVLCPIINKYPSCWPCRKRNPVFFARELVFHRKE